MKTVKISNQEWSNKNLNISKFRIALTRFRVSAHRLEVEAGRWHKPEKTF